MDQAMTQKEFLRSAAEAGDQANMWKIGQALGLDRSAAESLGLELMGQGLLEMVNLGGGVRITEAGLAGLGSVGKGPGPGPDLEALLGEIESGGDLGLDQKAMVDMEADLACLRAQLGRSRPLEAVVTACLEAVEEALAGSTAARAQELARRAGEFRG